MVNSIPQTCLISAWLEKLEEIINIETGQWGIMAVIKLLDSIMIKFDSRLWH